MSLAPVALLLVTSGCAGSNVEVHVGAPSVAPPAQLLADYYRTSGDHWLRLTDGSVLERSDEGVFCQNINSLLSGSGNRVCLYDDNFDSRFERAIIFSGSHLLEVFSPQVPIPYRKVRPARWPSAAPEFDRDRPEHVDQAEAGQAASVTNL